MNENENANTNTNDWNNGFPTWHAFLQSLSSKEEVEFHQLRRAYASSFQFFKECNAGKQQNTTYSLPSCVSIQFSPSDPDFPFNIDNGVALYFHLPSNYPNMSPSITIDSPDLSVLSKISIEKAMHQTATEMLEHNTPFLRRLLKWLDRNIESIITAAHSLPTEKQELMLKSSKQITKCSICNVKVQPKNDSNAEEMKDKLSFKVSELEDEAGAALQRKENMMGHDSENPCQRPQMIKQKDQGLKTGDAKDCKGSPPLPPHFLIVASHMQALREMGIEEEMAALALRITNNNLQEAINLSLTVNLKGLRAMAKEGMEASPKTLEKASSSRKLPEPNSDNNKKQERPEQPSSFTMSQADRLAFARFKKKSNPATFDDCNQKLHLSQSPSLGMSQADRAAFALLNKSNLLTSNEDRGPSSQEKELGFTQAKDLKVLDAGILADLEAVGLGDSSQPEQTNSVIDTANTGICKFFIRNRCKKGVKCPYLHSKPKSSVADGQASESQPQPQKKKKCRFFSKGHCKAGKKCKFYHAISGDTDASSKKIEEKNTSQQAEKEASSSNVAWNDEGIEVYILGKHSSLGSNHLEEASGTQQAVVEVGAEWSEEQQAALDAALAKFPPSMPKKERWHAIADLVESKSMKECIARYKEIREGLLRRKYDDAPEEENDDGTTPVGGDPTGFSKDKMIKLELNPTERGTRIELEDPFLLNIGTVQVGMIQLQMRCHRCPMTFDIELSVLDPKHTYRQWCKRCSVLHSAGLRPVLLHTNSNVLAYLDLESCHVMDVLPSTLLVVCEDCNREGVLKNFSSGKRHDQTCFGCHKSISIQARKFTVNQLDGPELCLVDGHDLHRKKKREPNTYNIKEGTPLPQNGTCSHYRKSRRWLRFPCCGKALPCDLCHEESDCPKSADGVYATRMICGLCSKEQPFSNKPCDCGASMGKQAISHHWEGGAGCRDTTQMSTKDSRKHAGKGKTLSKKELRTGKLAKDIRDFSKKKK